MTTQQVPARECRIGVGPATLAIECASPEYAASLRDYFATGVIVDGARRPDLRLELEVVPHEDLPRVPDSLFATKHVDGGAFDIDGGLVTGTIDSRRGHGRLRVRGILTKEPLTRVFEQLLYQAAYSVFLRSRAAVALVHACGVQVDGAGYLFVGESGCGKSTIAALSHQTGYRVLNDEICLVEFGPDGPVLRSTPFNGLYRDKQAGSARLRALLLPRHGVGHRLEKISPAFALARLTGQVVAPLPLEEPLTEAVSTRMLDLATQLVQSAPVRGMDFTPDAGFWPVILQEFPPKEPSA